MRFFILLILTGCLTEENEYLYSAGYDDGCALGQGDACKEERDFDVEETDEYMIGYRDGYDACFSLWREVNGC